MALAGLRGGDGLEGSLLTFRKGEGGLAVPEVWSPGFRHRQDTCPHTPDTPLAERETHQSPERLDAVHRGGGRTRGQTPPDPLGALFPSHPCTSHLLVES